MSDTETSAFTANETKLICAVMQNLTSDIQFDVDKVVLELGYKNAGSLRARWNSLKRSRITAAPTGGVDKATPSKKTKATPKKAKAAESDDGAGSPVKKGGKKGRKAKVKVKIEEDEAVDSVEGEDHVAVGPEVESE